MRGQWALVSTGYNGFAFTGSTWHLVSQWQEPAGARPWARAVLECTGRVAANINGDSDAPTGKICKRCARKLARVKGR